jgi:hypothetical protein
MFIFLKSFKVVDKYINITSVIILFILNECVNLRIAVSINFETEVYC